MYFLSGGLHVKVQPGSHHLHNYLAVDLRSYELENQQLIPKKGLQIPYTVWKDILQEHWDAIIAAFKDSNLRPTIFEYEIEPSIKGPAQKIRAVVDTYNDYVHLDFRVWIKDTEQFLPTVQGARLDLPTAEKLKDIHETKLKQDQAHFKNNLAAGKDFIYGWSQKKVSPRAYYLYTTDCISICYDDTRVTRTCTYNYVVYSRFTLTNSHFFCAAMWPFMSCSPLITDTLLFQMKRHMTRNDQPGSYLNPYPYQDKAVIELLITLLYEERDSKLKYKKNARRNERELYKTQEELADVKRAILLNGSPTSSVSGQVGSQASLFTSPEPTIQEDTRKVEFADSTNSL